MVANVAPYGPQGSAGTLFSVRRLSDDSALRWKSAFTDSELAVDFITKSGACWVLDQRLIVEYQQTYPHVAIVAELRKAQRWLLDNADRRKTARGMPRFINGWLARQERHVPMVGGRRAADVGSVVRETSCPHQPACPSPGNWQCQQRTVLEQARAGRA